ncbi:MAG: hypothetical protein AAGE94_03010 [Acidobacteriota bacterium]
MKDRLNASDDRTFILTTARVYVPGSLPKVVTVASETSGGGCCGSVPPTSLEDSSGCATSGCGTTNMAQQRTRCC